MKMLLSVLMCLCLVSPLLAENLLVNPGLETGTIDGWGARFGVGTVEVISSNPSPHSGLYCLRDYGRTATWHGAWQSNMLLPVVERGKTYPASVWVRTNTTEKTNIALTMQQGPTTAYINVGNVMADNTQWYQITGTYTVPTLEAVPDLTDIRYYVEATGSATCEIYIDDAVFGTDEEADGLPYAPKATPLNLDETVGTLTQVSPGVYAINDAVLSFKAGHDPNEDFAVNPNIAYHNVYLQYALPDDPNLLLVNYSLPQVSLDDPNQSLPLASVIPAIQLKQGTTYQWQVEMVMNDPNGGTYPAGSEHNILGAVWSFKTANAIPSITAITDHMLTVDGDTSFTITATNVANHYQWFKVVGVQDVAGGETDDVALADGGIYSGTQTVTLQITDAAADGSDDALVYAKAYNGAPGGAATQVSAPSAARWFWAPRMVNYYAFETMNVDLIEDLVGGSDITVKSNDIGVDKPALVSGPDPNNIPTVAAGIAGNTSSLKFHNPRTSPADPNNGDAQYAQIDNPLVVSYKDITISCWVYNAGGPNWCRIVDFGNSDNYNMNLAMNTGSANNRVRFAVEINNTERQVATPADGALPVGQWTHVAATLTGTTGRIYINGELQNTATNIIGDPIAMGPTSRNWLGRSNYATDGYFHGKIDELKIYNYALTTVEVGREYLADTLKEYVCDMQVFDFNHYDYNNNCLLDLGDFADMSSRWLEDDRIYPAD